MNITLVKLKSLFWNSYSRHHGLVDHYGISKDWVTRTPLKTRGELRCFGRVGSFCSTGGTSRVNLVTNPVISHNIRMPRDQKSEEISCPLLRMISGATYSGVPQNVQVFLPKPIFLAKPKSTYNRKDWIL
jgi:hypothetical protein